ncbi:kinetochore-associated Ndc80 complex subunit spc25 [Mortierella polycephala]|uniref:Kinetochore protein SPC25 n=1 Tax=Mortierella polycephala TaxID=41804 RepID=A0A9P6PNR6_9FUNG|nr:kinetochore-associated Ndc80 complex subunit spc25 [Mortierella polycephala]
MNSMVTSRESKSKYRIAQNNGIAELEKFKARQVFRSHQKLQEELRVAIAEEAALAKALDKEKEEASNMTKTVQQLSARYEELRQTRSHLENQIIALQKEVTAKRDAKIALKKALDEQMMKNKPELAAYEATLGLRIVGVKEDHIGFVFTRLNELDWDKEYSITIDVSQYDFAVSECTPNLPELSSLLQHLNETRDFYGFLKRARKAFKDLPNK